MSQGIKDKLIQSGTAADKIKVISTPVSLVKFGNWDENKVAELKNKYQTSWYNHIKRRPNAYHFLTAIQRTNLKALKGFDERYASGFCYDDNELITRIKRKGLQVIFVPMKRGMALHQCHKHIKQKRAISELGLLHKRNHKLFLKVTSKEKTWSADHNIYYPA